MKLTKEHIDRKVLSPYNHELMKVLGVTDDLVWAKYIGGQSDGFLTTIINCDLWQLASEDKKPSDRIDEIIRERQQNPIWAMQSTHEERMNALIQFLDEEWEKNEN